jgi:hypothetical protein
MKHYILNLPDGGREQAASLLRAKMWALGLDERHRGALAPGDLALIHVQKPHCEFIGRAKLETPFRDWTPLESEACQGRPSGVLLADVEEWPRPVALEAVVRQIDPSSTNPQVQANAAGFRSGLVFITEDEYAAVVALSREARQP